MDNMNDEGGFRLLQLLSQPLRELGYFNDLNLMLEGEKLEITDYLGHGGCSVVYKGLHKDKVPIKIYSQIIVYSHFW